MNPPRTFRRSFLPQTITISILPLPRAFLSSLCLLVCCLSIHTRPEAPGSDDVLVSRLHHGLSRMNSFSLTSFSYLLTLAHQPNKDIFVAIDSKSLTLPGHHTCDLLVGFSY